MQFIVSKKEFIPPVIAPDIIETLGDDYEIWTYEDYERMGSQLIHNELTGFFVCSFIHAGTCKERCVQTSKGVCSGTIRKWCVCGGY